MAGAKNTKQHERSRTMTTKTERFFLWVWRVNALILLVLAVAALIGSGALAYNVGIFAGRERAAEQVTRIGGTDLVGEELKLGSFHVIPGTDFLYAELAAPSRYIGSGSSDGLGTARNLLFFDTKTKTAHWLFNDNSSELLSWRMVYDEPRRSMTEEKESQLRVVGMILHLRAAAADEPNANRPAKLVLVSPDGTHLVTLVESIDSQLGQYHVDAETLLIFYARDGAVNVLDVDPINATVRSSSPLSVTAEGA